MISIPLRRLIILGILALIASLFCIFFVDQGLAQWLKANNVGRFYRPLRTLTEAGEAQFYFLIAIVGSAGAWAVLRFVPRLSEPLRLRLRGSMDWSLFFLYSLLASGLVLYLLKFTFGRQRPHVTDDYQAHVFDPFNLHWHNHSFPSGHSQTLFTAATILWITFPRWGWVAFPCAALLALTRVSLEAHFMSDVIMGSYVGFLVTVLVATRMSRVHSPQRRQ